MTINERRYLAALRDAQDADEAKGNYRVWLHPSAVAGRAKLARPRRSWEHARRVMERLAALGLVKGDTSDLLPGLRWTCYRITEAGRAALD